MLGHYSGYSLSLHLMERSPQFNVILLLANRSLLESSNLPTFTPARVKKFIRFCLFIPPTSFTRFLSGIKRLAEGWLYIKFCGLIKMIINCSSSLSAPWFVGSLLLSGTEAPLRSTYEHGRFKQTQNPRRKTWLGFWALVLTFVFSMSCFSLGLALVNCYWMNFCLNICGQSYCCLQGFLIVSAGMFLFPRGYSVTSNVSLSFSAVHSITVTDLDTVEHLWHARQTARHWGQQWDGTYGPCIHRATGSPVEETEIRINTA